MGSAYKDNTSQNSSELNKVNINSASKDELTSLKGIGDVYATAIIENRPYADPAELLTKAGLSQNLFESIEASITF